MIALLTSKVVARYRNFRARQHAPKYFEGALLRFTGRIKTRTSRSAWRTLKRTKVL
jgi:hypothetical protein